MGLRRRREVLICRVCGIKEDNGRLVYWGCVMKKEWYRFR